MEWLNLISLAVYGYVEGKDVKELVKKMHDINPKRNLVFTAIDKLSKPKDITQFHKEYREYMVDEGYTEKIADQNIGYVLGYMGKETRSLWYGILDVEHPVFGNDY